MLKVVSLATLKTYLVSYADVVYSTFTETIRTKGWSKIICASSDACLTIYSKTPVTLKELLQVFFPNETPATYKGIALSDLNRTEVHYNITIRVLSLIPKKLKTKNSKKGTSCTLKCVRGSLIEVQEGARVMTLNLYNHQSSDRHGQVHSVSHVH